jgi:hypothetical protein
MARVLLWNVQNKPLDGLVVRLAQQHRLDVVVLIERPESDSTLLQALQVVGPYARVDSHERFGVYTRFRAGSFVRLTPPVANDRVDFWRLRPPASNEVLLVAVHGLDRKNYPNEDRRALFFERVAENVRWAEADVGHKRTVLLGDFNANPFEPSIGGVRGLHAIRMRQINGLSYRTVMGRDYSFFYNPMWTCYGAGRNAAPATTLPRIESAQRVATVRNACKTG